MKDTINEDIRLNQLYQNSEFEFVFKSESYVRFMRHNFTHEYMGALYLIIDQFYIKENL